MNNQMKAPVVAALLIIAFALGLVFYNEREAGRLGDLASRNAEYLVRDYSPTVGDPNAKVTIVEFFDPACETCKLFHPIVKQMMAANPGRIKLVLRYLPLHQGSDFVVTFLEASRAQNRFWETLEFVFAVQSQWASHNNPQPQLLWQLLEGKGLDLNKLRQDMALPTVSQRIVQDVTDAQQLQVRKTPGFFVNGRPLVQFGQAQLKQLVDSELSKHY